MDLLSNNKSFSGIYLIQNTLHSKVYVGSSNEPTILVEREQFWMDSLQSYDPQFGYNSSTTANIFVNSEFLVAQPSKTKDWIVISPQGEKIFVRNLSAFCRENGLHRTSMVNVASGKTLTSRGR